MTKCVPPEAEVAVGVGVGDDVGVSVSVGVGVGVGVTSVAVTVGVSVSTSKPDPLPPRKALILPAVKAEAKAGLETGEPTSNNPRTATKTQLNKRRKS